MAKKDKTAELLASFLGKWTGTSRTHMEPGTPVLSAPHNAHIFPVLKTRTIGHTYSTKVKGKAAQGSVTIGKDLATHKLTLTWVNTFHTHGDVMQFAQDANVVKKGFSVSGKWSMAPGQDLYGWRITYRLAKPDRLEIKHYFVMPDGKEQLAIDIQLAKKGGAR